MYAKYELKKIRQGYDLVIGCDEVGRGSLAGPVVAAAVIMKLETWSRKDEIRDSKILTSEKREGLNKLIKANSIAWGVGEVAPEIIDQINIHQATLLAMKRAVEKLLAQLGDQAKSFLYIDGKFIIPEFNVEQQAIVQGDRKILSVAAASIIAKVYRDGLMTQLHHSYPEYEFAKHKGYGTALHREKIIAHGLSPIHRRSFCKNIKR